jgi:hypothetical protein
LIEKSFVSCSRRNNSTSRVSRASI